MSADLDRFDRRAVEVGGGCLQWTGYLNHKGYGQFKAQGVMWPAHRWIYTQRIGSIPEGLQIDHLCRNRACVNVLHMEAVTLVENVRRGATARDGKSAVPVGKSSCKNGHPFAGENLHITPNGQRRCRACACQWQRESRERRRDKEALARH